MTDSKEKFLERLRKVNLTLNAIKCIFFKNESDVLGFMVNANGVSPSPSKIPKIMNFPRPNNVSAIQASVNQLGVYRRHIPAFAGIAVPINNFLRKKVKFD
ncbi:hypothetical protein [Parasitella parasitica]|uniref:Reverse transcriptase domain-containing protein n=1 Tax=Parasitella parasitica TaxID=35722 RepID=A0A0B7NIA0_9FUNG|nr:hypothetical protein [Parasitella parasitica]